MGGLRVFLLLVVEEAAPAVINELWLKVVLEQRQKRKRHCERVLVLQVPLQLRRHSK